MQQIPVLIGCWLYSNSIYKPFTRMGSIIVAVAIVQLFSSMLGSLGVTPDLILLEYNKSSYIKEFSEIQAVESSPRIKTWLWRESGGLGGVFETLVYDDSDQITPDAAVKICRMEAKSDEGQCRPRNNTQRRIRKRIWSYH